MRVSPVHLIFCLAILSCAARPDEVVETKINPNYLRGQFAIGDSVLGEFDLWGCFCNKTDSGIRITNMNNGFEGQRLITTLNKRDTSLSFNTWTCVGGTPEYVIQKYSVTLVDNRFNIQDSIVGTINVQGTVSDSDTRIFRACGQFRCILKDSTYEFQDYEADLIRSLNDRELEKLKMVSLSNPDSVKEVELGSFGLTEIPVEIKRFKRLRTLVLAQNQIIKMDVALLAGLDSLRELDLSGNPISEIPHDINALENLEKLNLSGCMLKVLPNEIFELTRLKALDLSATPLTAIADEVKHFLQLEVLDIAHSDIRIVPKEIFDLPNLNSLTLPDSIRMFKLQGRNLAQLRKLGIPYDLIEYNKESLTKLRGLRDLSILFRYKDNKEAQSKHSKRIDFIGQALPSVDIFEVVIIEN